MSAHRHISVHHITRHRGRSETYRWPLVTQQTPVHFSEPFVLLNLAGSAPTPKTSSLIFVKQPIHDILAGTVRQVLSLSLIPTPMKNSPPGNFRCVSEMNWHRPDVGKSVIPRFSLEWRSSELHRRRGNANNGFKCARGWIVSYFSHRQCRSKLRRLSMSLTIIS
jgi:hypothetical protein